MCKEKGLDYSKDNVYDAFGRPDLKPKTRKLSAGWTARHDPELFDEMTRERDLIDLHEYEESIHYNL